MKKAEPIPDYVVTSHAAFEMNRRGIDEQTVRQVLNSPEQRLPVREGREVLQARLERDDPAKMYLIRVVVDVDRTPAEVVTVYRTSKLAKYWQE
jgi:hypothetical protein